MSAELVLEQVALILPGSSQPLFAPLDLSVPPGVIHTIMGPSGVGKSSLLAFVGGHLDPAVMAMGRVLLAGQDLGGLAPEQRHIGMLFQDPILFPNFTLGGNLAYGLPRDGSSRAARRARVDDALALVGLAGRSEQRVDSLSGGERVRAALMRALLAGPRALLLDEPFSRLNLALRNEVRQMCFSRLREAKIPCILVTHSPTDAEAAGGPVTELAAFTGDAGQPASGPVATDAR